MPALPASVVQDRACQQNWETTGPALTAAEALIASLASRATLLEGRATALEGRATALEGAVVRSDEANLRIIRGGVSAAGALTKGTGFTPSKPGTGTYDILFANSFASLPAAWAMIGVGGNVSRMIRQTAMSTTGLTFNVRSTESPFNSMDEPFDFIVISVE
jgi:hypothetical protein